MIFEQVQQIIADHFEMDLNEIGEDTSLADDLLADSLDVLDILMELEDRFDLNIPDEDAEELKTVGEIADYLEQNA